MIKLRLGYDSLGAGCFINHLHFEFIFLDDLNIYNTLIETKESKVSFKTKLEHIEENENV